MGARLCFLVALCCLPAPALAEPLGVGDRLEPIALEDQHGEERRLGPETELLLFTRDMAAGDVLKEALAEVTGETLAERGIVYVSDIHEMPALVARMFALPSMRRRAYPMLLDREGTVTADYPGEEGHVTLLRLDALEIRGVEQLADAGALREALGLAAAEAEAEAEAEADAKSESDAKPDPEIELD